MSRNSIARPRKKGWRQHLSHQRRIALYDASIAVVQIEARMQARLQLCPQDWAEIEARWDALLPLDSCFPQQRRDFLLHEEAAMVEHQAEVLQCSPTA